MSRTHRGARPRLSPPRPRLLDLRAALPVLVLVLAPAWWVFVYMVGRKGVGIPSYDIYAGFYPNVAYALRSLRDGHGLLWNPLQNCGQPFLPSTVLGPFYPPNLAFLVLDIDHGLLALAFFHLTIAGLGTYLLCRQIGLGRTAALCGAIGFELGTPALLFAGWLPATILGAFAWLPFALLGCERLLDAPSARAGVWLGAGLALSILAAYPQVTLFIYQTVLLRLFWEVVTGRGRAVVAAAPALGLGLILPLGLGAAQLAPAVEFAARSIRTRALSPEEMAPGTGLLGWPALYADFAARVPLYAPGPVAFAGLMPLALARRATRRQALFYALVLTLFTALAVDGPLQQLYLSLPLGTSFRLPARFLWVASFGAYMLTAIGAEALLRAPAGRLRRVLVVVLGAAAVWLLLGRWPPSPERWVVAGLAVAAALVPQSAGAASLRDAGGIGIPLVVIAAALYLSRSGSFTFVDGMPFLRRHAVAFAVLRAHMTPDDRFLGVAQNPGYGLIEKAASVFQLPSISDYEPQTSQRYAELEVLMRTDTRMRSINDYGLKWTRAPVNRRIFDLLATRYLVVDLKSEPLRPELLQSLRRLEQLGNIAVYENARAFPRAYYVPTATIEPDGERCLEELAHGERDLRRTVLLESVPPDGTGGPPDASGDAHVEEDRAEQVRIRVRANAPGFLVLTDQDYPGWSATVNGTPGSVLRANYAFRAVPVPEGESSVVFRYRPTRVWAGIGASLATLAVVVALLWRGARR